MRLNRNQKLLGLVTVGFIVFRVVQCLQQRYADARLYIPIAVAVIFFLILLFLLRTERKQLFSIAPTRRLI